MDSFGFLKVAAAVPHVRVGDCDFNAERMAAMADEAAQRGVEIVAFPELALTAYTCGDLLLQPALLDAADEALARLVRDTRKLPLTMIAGAPLRHGQTLYNCAVVFTQGRILGVVPKTYIPDYTEFYENRWFASGAGISEETIPVAGQAADFGAGLTFEVNGTEFGVELCEDLWTVVPPSSHMALLPAAARSATVGTHDRGVCLLLGRLRRIIDRPGIRRERHHRRKREDPARSEAFRARRAVGRGRPRHRTAGIRTPQEHLVPRE